MKISEHILDLQFTHINYIIPFPISILFSHYFHSLSVFTNAQIEATLTSQK